MADNAKVDSAAQDSARGNGAARFLSPKDEMLINQQQAAQRTPDSSYQTYLFGSSGSDERPAWSDSMKGRAAIRILSRGIVGAAFFTIGGRMAQHQLRNYNKDAELTWNIVKENPLQLVAKGFDVTFGKLISSSVELFAKAAGRADAAAIAEKAVTFRTTRHFKNSNLAWGRSYGAEVVGITFDFAMASIGDALTRNVVQMIDPNIRKSWHINDKGEVAAVGEKYHTDWGKLGKHILSTGWRVLSKNQGEDWAAAIPYVYQMKFQRQFLSSVFNKRFDGHKIAFDHGWNGGAYKVNQAGQVVGDYQLAGAIDLHARFVGYNWYTLMYREAYDSVGNAFKKWKEDGFAIHPHWPENKNPLVAAVDAVGASVRYVTKSFIKANMYMNPAVVPFWLMRVPQSKWRAGTVHVDGHSPAEVTGFDKAPQPNFYDPVHYQTFKNETRLDKAEKIFSRALNPIGWVSHSLGTQAAKASDKMVAKGWWPNSPRFNRILEDNNGNLAAGRREFMREYVDASLSYTPYMWAKAETALRVDDTKGDGKPGLMDMSIYRFIDDVTSFNFKEVPADLKKMWKLGTNFEREIKVREGDDSAQQIATITSKPKPTVQAETLSRHAPVSVARNGAVANDGRWVESVGQVQKVGTAEKPASNDEDSRWSKKVANGDYHVSQNHPGNHTRH